VAGDTQSPSRAGEDVDDGAGVSGPLTTSKPNAIICRSGFGTQMQPRRSARKFDCIANQQVCNLATHRSSKPMKKKSSRSKPAKKAAAKKKKPATKKKPARKKFGAMPGEHGNG
jgi:hypothetical protein